MEFVMIDFSDVYYGTLVKEPKPSHRGGKFVQIRNEDTDTEYVVIAPDNTGYWDYHARIIDRFCFTMKIKGDFIDPKNEVFEFSRDEHGWVIIGGGEWKINEETKQLNLSGASQAYGSFDARGLKKRLLETEKLSGYKILVNGI